MIHRNAGDTANTDRPIGGFFGLELPVGGGFRQHWQLSDPCLAFANARSAFAALLEAVGGRPIWLPAYICPEFAAVVPHDRLRWYPIEDDLSPCVPFLEHWVRSDDLVLGVDFFGRPPNAAFLAFVAGHPRILFVEDCAQAIDTGQPAWGDWRLFSPRKLVGVPDGGLLVACSVRAETFVPSASVSPDFAEAVTWAMPQLSRFEDRDELSNEIWHTLNQAKEAALTVSASRISRLSWELLGLFDVDTIGVARRRNFEVLAALLPELALLKEASPSFVPLGFPVCIPAGRRTPVREVLHRHRIFPSVHWEGLRSPAATFAREHTLADQLLTLPCDHRYGPADMERVAIVLREALG